MLLCWLRVLVLLLYECSQAMQPKGSNVWVETVHVHERLRSKQCLPVIKLYFIYMLHQCMSLNLYDICTYIYQNVSWYYYSRPPLKYVASIGYYDTSVEWPYFSVVTNFTTPQRHAKITLNNNIEIYYLGLGKRTSIWLSHSTSTGVITLWLVLLPSSRKILCECAKANLCINGTPWTKKMSVFLYLLWAPKIQPFPTM